MESIFQSIEILSKEKGIDLNPNDWMAHHALGYVLIVGGCFEAGLEALDNAQRLSPHSAFSAGVLSMRAGALIALHRYDEAAMVAPQSVPKTVWKQPLP